MSEILPGLYAAPNVHPMFVHFPIALWSVSLLFWGAGLLRGRDDLFAVGRWLLYLGTASGLVAGLTGWLGAEQLGHESSGHSLVHSHRNLMLVALALAIVLSVAAFVWRRASSFRIRGCLAGILLAVNGFTILGADRGVVIVYGENHVGEDTSGSASQADRGPSIEE